jgi:hypothetical protein
MDKEPYRACLLCICFCKVFRKKYIVKPKHKVNSTVDSSISAEVKEKEKSTFEKQMHISQQNSLMSNTLLSKGKTLPVEANYCKLLLSRHDDVDCDSEKAMKYDDVVGVPIMRNRLRVVEDAEETYDPRSHTL